MLAWVHQAMAQEKDLFEQLFGTPEHSDAAENAAATTPSAADAEEGVNISDLLDKVCWCQHCDCPSLRRSVTTCRRGNGALASGHAGSMMPTLLLHS